MTREVALRSAYDIRDSWAIIAADGDENARRMYHAVDGWVRALRNVAWRDAGAVEMTIAAWRNAAGLLTPDASLTAGDMRFVAMA